MSSCHFNLDCICLYCCNTKTCDAPKTDELCNWCRDKEEVKELIKTCWSFQWLEKITKPKMENNKC